MAKTLCFVDYYNVVAVVDGNDFVFAVEQSPRIYCNMLHPHLVNFDLDLHDGYYYSSIIDIPIIP